MSEEIALLHWGGGEPSHANIAGEAENCVEIHASGLYMNDIVCRGERRAVCQRRNTSTSSGEGQRSSTNKSTMEQRWFWPVMVGLAVMGVAVLAGLLIYLGCRVHQKRKVLENTTKLKNDEFKMHKILKTDNVNDDLLFFENSTVSMFVL